MIETPLLIGIIAVVVILLIILLIVFGLRRKKAKTVSFTPKPEVEQKELTQEQKSGNYQAKGGFNFAPANAQEKKEPVLRADQRLDKPAAEPKVDATAKVNQQLREEIKPEPVAKDEPLIGEPVTPDVDKAPSNIAEAEATNPQPAKEAKKEEEIPTSAKVAGSAAAVTGVAGAGVAAVSSAKAEAESKPEPEKEEAKPEPAPEPEATKVEPIVDADQPTAGTAESEDAKKDEESEAAAEGEFAELQEFHEDEHEYERPEETELTEEGADAVAEVDEQATPAAHDEAAEAHADAAAEKAAAERDAAQAQAFEADRGEFDSADVPDAEPEETPDAEATEAAVAAATIEEAVEQALDKIDAPEEIAPEQAIIEEPAHELDEIDPAAGRIGRLRGRLSRSQNVFGQSVLGMLSAGDLDDDAWEEIEDELIGADLGANITMNITDELRDKIAERGVSSEAEARAMLRETLIEACHPEMDRSIKAMPNDGKPAVILVVGVNGTGKTTTTGKLARVLVSMGHNVVLGAADTFRAAAADQLETWGRRVGAKTVRGKEGADPASVAFDAVAEGVATGADVVLIDTAGRLHNSNNLMDQLGKVKRVVEKKAIVDEVLLVLDATTGQNGMEQAKVFRDVVNITGVVLTKLDGSAKGGIVFRVQEELGVPVKLVGLGEGADHLAPFEVEGFVDALLGTNV